MTAVSPNHFSRALTFAPRAINCFKASTVPVRAAVMMTGSPSSVAVLGSTPAARSASITAVHAWEMADNYLDDIEARTHADEWQALGEQLLGEALGDWRDRHPDV